VEVTGQSADYEALVREKKLAVLDDALAADLTRLTAVFVEVCEHHRRYRDYTRRELRQVLREAIACFPVYRTYCTPGRPATEVEAAAITEGIETAAARRPDLDADRLFRFLRDLLLQAVSGGAEEELVARFQQLTGPVMAKGVEDTAFYVYNRLTALNEVGGHPGRFGVSVADFHKAMAAAQRDWPAAMLTTSTHDTKRSEDVRARLALLSQIPDEWGTAVRRWLKRRPGPEPNTAYLFYQSLVGAWPWSPERAAAYMEKATKEAKTHTSWTAPDPAFDEAVQAFAADVFADAELLDDVARFTAPLVVLGRINSMAQALIKLTAPGVPDVYQGCELWDLSLVDPDNRRPVDFDLRRGLLSRLDVVEAAAALSDFDDPGLPKLLVTSRALHLRRERPDLFTDYQPLDAPDNVVAYSRGGAVTVVPRLVLSSPAGDGSVALPPGRWRDVITDASFNGGDGVPVRSLLEAFPVALLEAV
jgi:(1->4)-alpha-D-glucan 1-alpha-D-glucosylmutase